MISLLILASLLLYLSLFTLQCQFFLFVGRTELLCFWNLLCLLLDLLTITHLIWAPCRHLILGRNPLRRRLYVRLLLLLQVALTSLLVAFAFDSIDGQAQTYFGLRWHFLVRHRVNFGGQREIEFVVGSVRLPNLLAWFIFVAQRISLSEYLTAWEPRTSSLHILHVLLYLLKIGILEDAILLQECPGSHISQNEVRNAFERVILITCKSVDFVALLLMNYYENIGLKFLV